MAKQIRLLIVDDNAPLAAKISAFMNAQQEIEVVGTAENAREALEMVKLVHPNAIVADLIMPQTDGFFLLEKLSGGEYGPMPKIIMLSAVSSESLYARAIALGATYYMNKPFSMDTLYQRLLDFFDLRKLDIQKQPALVRSKSLDERITSIFLSIGIPAHIKGYQFLKEAIKLVIKKPEIINSITKQLYPSIARNFETSPSKVERAIRHAIEVAWNRGRIENLNTIFGYNIYTKNDKPTNGEFIALIADRLMLEESA